MSADRATSNPLLTITRHGKEWGIYPAERVYYVVRNEHWLGPFVTGTHDVNEMIDLINTIEWIEDNT